MKRRLLNLLALVSLALFVATAAVAVRGQFFSRGSTFGPQNDRVTWRVNWRDGRIYSYFSPGYVTQFSIYAPGASIAGIFVNRGNTPDGLPIFVATASPAHVWGIGGAACRPARAVLSPSDARRPAAAGHVPELWV